MNSHVRHAVWCNISCKLDTAVHSDRMRKWKRKWEAEKLIVVASVWCCSVVGPESRATEVIWLWTLTAVWLVPHDSRASLTQTEAPIGTALRWLWSLSQYFQLWRPVPIAQIARQDWRRRKEPNVSSLCRGVFWKAQLSDYEYNKSAIISVERDRKRRTPCKTSSDEAVQGKRNDVPSNPRKVPNI